MKSRTMLVILAFTIAIAGLPFFTAFASSHREASGIARLPQVDGTDFYMFRSYEDGRGDFVTIIANYNPLQDPFGGPNYFPLDSNAQYDIHITNDGDAVEDLTFRFQILEVGRHAGGLFLGEGGYALHSRLPHILWLADPPTAHVLYHL